MFAYQRGDVSAFDSLYQRHKDGLFSFLYHRFQRESVVEELAQETWMAVVNRASQYQPTAQFRTWLFQIARNRMADFWRRKDNHHGGLDQVAEPSVNGSDVWSPDLDILDAIGRLPNDQQDALLLHHQGFSHREIADLTDSLEETVKSRLRYGRKRLREALGGAYETA
jgi:RNA polymerase sigma-70 factor (ECF subfamily)